MIYIECLQGGTEWLEARCGKVTASEFSTACKMLGSLTPQQALFVRLVGEGVPQAEAIRQAGYKAMPTSTSVHQALAGRLELKHSDEAIRYAHDLAIEQISGRPYGEPVRTWALDRGHTLEYSARMAYEARTGYFVTEAGLCITDDELHGYSTDGLVGDDGLIEIKCPIDSVKIAHVIRTGDVSEYMHQMQGGMWITGRKWCDFIQYTPDLANSGKDLFVKRVDRDDVFIDAMVEALMLFQELILSSKAVFS